MTGTTSLVQQIPIRPMEHSSDCVRFAPGSRKRRSDRNDFARSTDSYKSNGDSGDYVAHSLLDQGSEGVTGTTRSLTAPCRSNGEFI